MANQLQALGFQNPLMLGTAGYPSPEVLRQALLAAKCEVVTMTLRRESAGAEFFGHEFLEFLRQLPVRFLPNTAGCRSAKEAVLLAQLAREVFGTHWIKLEITSDPYTLLPDSLELLRASAQLLAAGFEVFPYCTDDLSVASQLVWLGCRILMPGASPIGSGQGIRNPWALSQLRKALPDTILIVDAGLGAPSHAAWAMEMGFDAVLVNTAVANSTDPRKMAEAFAKATWAGRQAYEAGLMKARDCAVASTPNLGQPFWHQQRGLP